MESGTSERREFIRIPFDMEVTIEVEGMVLQANKGINISMGGLHLSAVDAKLTPGALCSIVIMLNTVERGPTLEAEGKVIRSGPGGLAIEFTELELDSYHHLRQLVLLNTAEPDKAEQEFDAHWGIRPRAF
jgi:PilZ domain